MLQSWKYLVWVSALMEPAACLWAIHWTSLWLRCYHLGTLRHYFGFNCYLPVSDTSLLDRALWIAMPYLKFNSIQCPDTPNPQGISLLVLPLYQIVMQVPNPMYLSPSQHTMYSLFFLYHLNISKINTFLSISICFNNFLTTLSDSALSFILNLSSIVPPGCSI